MKVLASVAFAVFSIGTAYSQAPSISAAGIVNAASYTSGFISPGEIILIYGNNLGPTKLTLQTPTSSGFGSSLAGVQVAIGGVPAPLLYVAASQVSVVVPYEIANMGQANVTLSYNNSSSNTVSIPVTATQLGLFSADSSGSGVGAILDANYSPISATNQASPGQTILVFGTGEGVDQTTVLDGSLVPSSLTKPKATITATVGGMPATVAYAGGSPGLIAGLLQINITIPSGVVNCSSVGAPLVVTAGSQSSQLTIVVAMKKAASCPADLSFKSATINGNYTVTGLGTYTGTVSINSNGDGTYTAQTLAVLPTLGFKLIFPSATISGNVVSANTVLKAGTDVGGQTPTSASFMLTISPESPLGGVTFVTATGTTMGTSAAGSVTAKFSTTGQYDGFIQ